MKTGIKKNGDRISCRRFINIIQDGGVSILISESATSDTIDVRIMSNIAGASPGDAKQGFASAAPTGWVLLHGGTIGNASSGATIRANADTQSLFQYLWNNLADAQATVTPGPRGGDAITDFNANKTITLPNMSGRMPLGKTGAGTGSTIGGTGGSLDHSHSINTGGSHNHTGNTGTPSTQELQLVQVGVSQVPASGHTHPISTDGSHDHGGLTGSNNPPFLAVYWYIKL